MKFSPMKLLSPAVGAGSGRYILESRYALFLAVAPAWLPAYEEKKREMYLVTLYNLQRFKRQFGLDQDVPEEATRFHRQETSFLSGSAVDLSGPNRSF